jgi:hypothetical protein
VAPRGKLASKNDHCRNLDEAFIVEETTLGTQHFKWGKLVYICSADIHGANNMMGQADRCAMENQAQKGHWMVHA